MEWFFNKLDCFLVIPANEIGEPAQFFELIETSHHKKNSFVLLPYQNPKKTDPDKLFFEIIKRSNIDLPAPTMAQQPHICTKFFNAHVSS